MSPFSKLNEIVKLSALRATSALSKLLREPIGVDILPIEVKKLNEIEELLDGNETIVGSYIPLVGKLHGASLILYPYDSAKAICDAMLHRQEGNTQTLSSKEISALQEVANIVIGNFLTAFALPLKVDKLLHRTPDFNAQSFLQFYQHVMAELPKSITDGLVVNISFHFKHTNISGTAIFLFNENEMKILVQKLTQVFS